jgi:L-rhamnonate dehydratase
VQPIAPSSPPDWRTSLGQILVAVDTDAGLTGYGVGGGGLAGVHVVRTVLRDVVLGRDASAIGVLGDAMYHATLAFGRKGLAIMAQSGVDLALWDLKGKAERCSVARLLGGAIHSSIPVYTTVWDEVRPEQAGRFQAFKLHLETHTGPERTARIVAAVAKARAVIGFDRPLMIDAWMEWDLETTLAVAQGVQPYRLDWIEEPLPADDWRGYAALTAQCPIPIAGGEHEFMAVGFADVIERRMHQVLQPDVCWCGGLTELVKIYALARQAGLRVCPHRGAELWALPALAALDPQPLAEVGRPWMTWVGGQPPVEDGFIRPGETPGFGVVIDEACLQTR